MTKVNSDALEFLLNRRSCPAKTLIAPAPTRQHLAPILTAAARTPDHGKLEPWRFIVLAEPALKRLAELAKTRGNKLNMDVATLNKGVAQYTTGLLAVAVVHSPIESPKIPKSEQVYSTGAVCLSLLNAALASGWGANWLSGWASHDREFVEIGLGLSKSESIAGLIFMGTKSAKTPERPRPDLSRMTTWVDR